jgi:hypothetical protein
MNLKIIKGEKILAILLIPIPVFIITAYYIYKTQNVSYLQDESLPHTLDMLFTGSFIACNISSVLSIILVAKKVIVFRNYPWPY